MVAVGVETFDHLDLGVSVTDSRATILYINERAREIYAMPHQAALIGQSLRALEPSEFFLERADLLERLVSTGRSGVVREIVAGRQIVSDFLVTGAAVPESDRLCLGFHSPRPGLLAKAVDRSSGVLECRVHDWGCLRVLTRREFEVLALICEGKSTAEIAVELHRAEETIKSHKASLMRKLGCENAVQLAKVGWVAGITRRDAEVFARD